MRYAFLTLLAGGAAHGYELKQALEQRFGELLGPINHGQIYSTLQRLERDGLVAGVDVAGDTRGKRVYVITDSGRDELAKWLDAPTPAGRLRDEFAMKFLLAGLSGVVDPRGLIERQRRELLQTLRDLETHRRASPNGLATELLIEGAAFHAEADLKWLDLVSLRLETKENGDGERD